MDFKVQSCLKAIPELGETSLFFFFFPYEPPFFFPRNMWGYKLVLAIGQAVSKGSIRLKVWGESPDEPNLEQGRILPPCWATVYNLCFN